MKAIILAAGRGERMGILTKKTPKPLLKFRGKPIIDYVLASLPSEIDEIIIVVKYRGRQIREYLGKSYGKAKIRYVTGSNKGNAYSFLNTRKYLNNERFLLIYGDEVPNPVDVERCLAEKLSYLLYKSKNYWLMDGVMVLNTDIFNYETGEENFKDMVDLFRADNNVSLVLSSDGFIGELNTPDKLYG